MKITAKKMNLIDENEPGTGTDLSKPSPNPASGPLTTTGEECHLPYNYKGETYQSCSHVDHGGPW